MALSKPRAGTLQYWPRKRAAKLLPSVNWPALQRQRHEKELLGGICYKAGMLRCLVVDNTPHSMMKGKQIVLPITILECPPMRIAGIRFYKNDRVVTEITLPVPEKEVKQLKRKMRLPKEIKLEEALKKIEQLESRLDEFSDVRIIIYSLARLTGIKKSPDIAEIGLAGTLSDKLKFIKEKINKEITFSDIFKIGSLVDVRGLTKGKGLAGPIKRFGIALKPHKTEKGRRRPGTLGPWTPSRVTFRAPEAGQLGFFTRIIYNLKILDMGSASQLKFEFPHYGRIKTNYILLKGSVQGPAKRQLLLTAPLRPTKKTLKQNFELIRLMK